MSRENAIASVVWRQGGLKELCKRHVEKVLPTLFDVDDLEEFPLDVEKILDVYERTLSDERCRAHDMPARSESIASMTVARTRTLPFYAVIQYRYGGEKDDAVDLDAWQGTNDKYSRIDGTIPSLDAISKKWCVLATFQLLSAAEIYTNLFKSMEKRLSNDTGKGPSYAYTRTDHVTINRDGIIERGSKEQVHWLTGELFKSAAPHYLSGSIEATLPRILSHTLLEFIESYEDSPISTTYGSLTSIMPHDVRFAEIADGIQCKLLFGQFGIRVPERFRSIESEKDLRVIMITLRKAVDLFHSHIHDPSVQENCISDEEPRTRNDAEESSSDDGSISVEESSSSSSSSA